MQTSKNGTNELLSHLNHSQAADVNLVFPQHPK
jgi:hypothetical protein